MNKTSLLGVFGIFVLSSFIGWYFQKQRNEVSVVTDMSHLGGDFTLKGSNGIVSLEQFRGKVVLLYFGFTSCPDVCPLALSILANRLETLDQSLREKLQVIFISVDWKRDNPKSAHEYAQYFAKDFVGVTGDQKSIDETIKKYAGYYKFVEMKDSELGYTVDHSSRYYLIDKNGTLRSSFSDAKNDPEFLKELTRLLE